MSLTLLLWLVVGALLIGGELMTGTLYLLIFGMAAWIGATASFLGAGLDGQLVAAGMSALVGLGIVMKYGKRWRRAEGRAPASLDVGNEVRIEVANGAHLRVLYRGSTWDAVLEVPGAALKAGDLATIRAVRGSTLVVEPSGRHAS